MTHDTWHDTCRLIQLVRSMHAIAFAIAFVAKVTLYVASCNPIHEISWCGVLEPSASGDTLLASFHTLGSSTLNPILKTFPRSSQQLCRLRV